MRSTFRVLFYLKRNGPKKNGLVPVIFDSHLWIKTNRQKTGTESNIRLLEVAKRVIEKYDIPTAKMVLK